VTAAAKVLLDAGGWIAFQAARAIAASTQFDWIGRENVRAALASRRPVVCAHWHGEMLPFLMARLELPLPYFLTMASRSKDGELAAAAARPYGIHAARGSSSRGGARGLMELVRLMERPGPGGAPYWVAMALDGPRGPRHEVKPGAILLARRTGALILPVVAGAARRATLASWDRGRLPLPFGRIVYAIGEPIEVKSEAAPTAEDLGRTMHELAEAHPLCRRDRDEVRRSGAKADDPEKRKNGGG
jgi:hypothetical protein